jgi:hypothetical protein
MSQPRGFGLNGAKLFTNVVTPQEVWCNFIIDSANGNGLGTRSLKSNGYIESVFMHTSSTPGTVGNKTNPNPVAGYALVTFKNNFNYYLGGFSGQIVPLTSTSTTSLTSTHAYVITSLGTTTLAQWQTAGLPAGLTPTVGQAFISTAGGALGGTGTVGLPGVQVAPTVSVVGDPNQSISNASVAANAGAMILLQFSGPTSTSNPTLVATAPADGTVVSLQFCFDRSTVTIDGL